MRIGIVSIFPEIFDSFLKTSLIKKAIDRNLLSVEVTNPRCFSEPPHFQVDDSPYGGGAGMVMKAEPIIKAVEDLKKKIPESRVIALTAAGYTFNQKKAHELSQLNNLILICGRYEGIDQRALELVVDEEISIGDYVLMGGEIPAMVVIESCLRLRENVIGNTESLMHESFSDVNKLSLEAPHYTRPETVRGLKVPDVLVKGNHKLIEQWRAEQSNIRTKARKG